MKAVCVYCGSSNGARPVYAEAAKAFGRALVENNLSLVYGGGRVGLMGLIADEVLAAGGRAVGVIPELLLAKDYEVHGVIRRASTFNTERIDHIYEDPHAQGVRLFLHYGDLSTAEQLTNLIYNVQPDEIYHLGAQSHVRVSFDQPEYTADVVATGTLRILDAVRDYAKSTGRSPRFYQAGSSEMFGAANPPQSEKTPFYPRSPYAAAKVAAHWYAVNYREAYGLFISNGILFNHESPLRPQQFITRKVTLAFARMAAGQPVTLSVGNLEAARDWGFAGDYVDGMWRMVQQPEGADYVLATGIAHTVRQLIETAAGCIGRKIEWRGEGGQTEGIDGKSGQVLVKIDPAFYRPADITLTVGNAAKAARELDWRPAVKFDKLIAMMIEADLTRVKAGGAFLCWRIRRRIRKT